MTRFRHNVNAAKVSEIFHREIVDMTNDIAEAIAGGQAGGRMIGIASIFKAKSPPPSTAPDPPGVRTGSLRRSFRTRVKSVERGRVVVAAGTDTKYAKPLEFGSRRGLEPRPFMAKGIRSAGPYIAKRIAKVGPMARVAIRQKIGRLS
jgi:hypothetical protein